MEILRKVFSHVTLKIITGILTVIIGNFYPVALTSHPGVGAGLLIKARQPEAQPPTVSIKHQQFFENGNMKSHTEITGVESGDAKDMVRTIVTPDTVAEPPLRSYEKQPYSVKKVRPLDIAKTAERSNPSKDDGISADDVLRRLTTKGYIK